MTSVAVLSHVILFWLNTTKVLKDERHAKLVQLVRNRRVDVLALSNMATAAGAKAERGSDCNTIIHS